MSHEDQKKALLERIAKAKAEREQLDAEAEERAELARLQREAIAAENALRDEPHIAKAEEEHGALGEGIAVIDTPRGAIVIKRPHHLVFRKFSAKEKPKIDEIEAFVRSCLVYPAKDTFESIAEEFSGTYGACVNAITVLMTNTSKERSGKS